MFKKFFRELQNRLTKPKGKRKFLPDPREEIIHLKQDFKNALPSDGYNRRFIDICLLEPNLSARELACNVRDLLDNFGEKNGLKRIGDNWQEISEKTATWSMQRLLNQDLAYGTDLLDPRKIGWIVQEFVWRVARGFTVARTGKKYCRYFINGENGGPTIYTIDLMKEISGWMPTTDHTFDRSIMIITPLNIALMHGWDED